jgi:hypothetical protein
VRFFSLFFIIFCFYFQKYGSIVYMKREKLSFLVILLLWALPLVLCFGQDERSKPVEVYLLFDNSASMQGSEQEAGAWISGHLADNILQVNDSLTIWSFADAPVEEFSGIITGEETMDEIKNILSSIAVNSSSGAYETAFEELQRKAVSHAQYAHAYIILVAGISEQNSSLFSTEAADVLKYSLSKDFSGWKVMIVSFGIEQKVKAAAAAYMSSQG